jgi:hypothetical protein
MNITIAKFKYDKGTGSTPTKNRKLLVLSKPNDSYFGIEFDNTVEIQNYLNYMAERETLDAYLKHKFNLSEENYKRFKVSKIICLTEEKISL